jgi:hypothetical protein
MKDKYGKEIKVGDFIRVGVGCVSAYEVVRFEGDSVVMLDGYGVEFSRDINTVSRW